MGDNSKYEFWDYRSTESAAQFRVYKEIRLSLRPYEEYFHRLVKELALESKGKKNKFEWKASNGDSIVTVKLRTQKAKEEVLCKEVWIDYPDETRVIIDFDKDGLIKSIDFDESLKARPTRNRPLLNLLDSGFPNVGMGQNFSLMTRSPVKEIKLYTENPERSEIYIYASYGQGLQWTYEVDREGKFGVSDIPFPRFLITTLDTILPSSIKQSIGTKA